MEKLMEEIAEVNEAGWAVEFRPIAGDKAPVRCTFALYGEVDAVFVKGHGQDHAGAFAAVKKEWDAHLKRSALPPPKAVKPPGKLPTAKSRSERLGR